ncbi:hypothetical protein WJX81_007711 [Elliptochloris bilobata]|uniref:F-box domain-containing protein n=1 Tax=Elliptochloris bilobata TaxID=381761 RepID=A0AAW1QCP2_9CHLO
MHDIGESAYEAERRKRIAANRAKLEALGLRCQTASALTAFEPCARAAPALQRTRARPAEQVLEPTRLSRRVRRETPQSAEDIARDVRAERSAAGDASAKRAAAGGGARVRVLPPLSHCTIVAPFSLRSIGVTVWELGGIHRGAWAPRYWSSPGCLFHHAYPPGYRASKAQFGRRFCMAILAGDTGPVFQVVDEASGRVFSGQTPTQPWTQVCLAHNTGQRISGPLFFGFSDPTTQRAIAALYQPEEVAAAMQGERAAAAEPAPEERCAAELCEVAGVGEATAMALALTSALGWRRHGGLASLRAWVSHADHAAQLLAFLLHSEEIPEATRRWPARLEWERRVFQEISTEVWCLVAQPLLPTDRCVMKATCRAFRMAVDLSWQRITLDLNRLAQSSDCAPNLSHFGGLREVLVTCNAGRQLAYWKIDYIGNEHAPGLTPAALRGALSRVHLDRLPEHGSDTRVLTVRGVGFEVSAKWLERLLGTKRCGGAARFGSVRLDTDCLPDSGLAAQLSEARARLEALSPERCLPALLSGAYTRLALLEVTGVEHWPARHGCTKLLAALRPSALPALKSLILRGAPEFGVVPAEALMGLALPGLTSLTLEGVAGVSGGTHSAFAFSALAHLTGLGELRLCRQQIALVNPGWHAAAAAGASLAALAPMRRLGSLRVDRLRSWAGVAALGGALTRLRVLLGPPNVLGDGPGDLAGLGDLPHLRELDLDLRMQPRLARTHEVDSLPPTLRSITRLQQLRQLVLREAADVEGCGCVRATFEWLLAPLAARLPHLEEFVLLGSQCAEAAWAPPPHGCFVCDLPAGGRLWSGSCLKDSLLDCLHMAFLAHASARRQTAAECVLGAEMAAASGVAGAASDAEPDSDTDSDLFELEY